MSPSSVVGTPLGPPKACVPGERFAAGPQVTQEALSLVVSWADFVLCLCRECGRGLVLGCLVNSSLLLLSLLSSQSHGFSCSWPSTVSHTCLPFTPSPYHCVGSTFLSFSLPLGSRTLGEPSTGFSSALHVASRVSPSTHPITLHPPLQSQTCSLPLQGAICPRHPSLSTVHLSNIVYHPSPSVIHC